MGFFKNQYIFIYNDDKNTIEKLEKLGIILDSSEVLNMYKNILDTKLFFLSQEDKDNLYEKVKNTELDKIRLNVNNFKHIDNKIILTIPPDLENEVNCGSEEKLIYENGTILDRRLLDDLKLITNNLPLIPYVSIDFKKYYCDFENIKILHRETLYYS